MNLVPVAASGPARDGVRAEPASVSVDKLSLHFAEKPILKDISLELPAGQFTAIIGPSGCGKSTLLNILAGFIGPESSNVTMGGAVRVGEYTPGASGLRCGVVFQEYALFSWRTARRNIEFALEARGVRAARERQRSALIYLEQVGLSEAANLYPHQLSGGMKQRVAIARALAFEPSILLMDEPLGAVDAMTRERLMDLIDQVWRGSRTTVVYVTHNIAEAVVLADRVVVLKSDPGEIVLDLSVDLPRPRDPLSAEAIAIERRLRAAIPGMTRAQHDARPA